jgi:hypothetical protein
MAKSTIDDFHFLKQSKAHTPPVIHPLNKLANGAEFEDVSGFKKEIIEGV